jgi:hypothetical protein
VLRAGSLFPQHRDLLWLPPPVARVSIELTTSPLWAERSGRLSYLAMVGHRGIEPRDTCVSGRPLRPVGSWPADAAGVEPARPRLARVQAGFRHQIGLRTHERRGRESNSQGRSSTAFGAGPVADRVASPWRRTEYSKPTRKGATRFPGGDRTLTASSSVDRTGVEPAYARWGSSPCTARIAESGELESHGVTRALVSSEARPLAGSLSVPFPGFEPGRHPPEGCGSASWPRRARTASG